VSSGITDTDSMMSVREMPWHGMGAVLEDYPTGIDDALEKSGLSWEVEQRPLFVPVGAVAALPYVDQPFTSVEGTVANVRNDNNQVLGLVSESYEIVQNHEAFKFLDAILGTDLLFETAGSLHGGRKVWVLARRPDFVSVAGDQVATYVFVASSHDGSMSVTSAVTPVRIVCANTLGAALYGTAANRTFRMRHTSGIDERWEEAREVIGATVDYESQFVALGDSLGQKAITERQFSSVLDGLFQEDDSLGKRALANRQSAKADIMTIYKGEGAAGDTTGNAPGSAWTAWNAVGEWSDWYRGRTKNTDQMTRSFEDTGLKQAALNALVAV